MPVSDPRAVKTQSNGWHGVWAFATSVGNQWRRGGDFTTMAFPERQVQHGCCPCIASPHLPTALRTGTAVTSVVGRGNQGGNN